MGTMKSSRIKTALAALFVGALVLTGCSMGGPPEPPETATEGLVPMNLETAGVTYTSDGVLESDAAPAFAAPPETDAIDVGMVFDPMCPHCANFEAQFGETIASLIDSGDITLTAYPVAFVAGELSEKSANAFYAVVSYSPEHAQEFQTELLAANLVQGGLDDDALIELAASVGATDEKIEQAITEGSFIDLIKGLTEQVLGQEIPGTGVTLSGTPLIFAEGVELESPTFSGTPEEALATLESQL